MTTMMKPIDIDSVLLDALRKATDEHRAAISAAVKNSPIAQAPPKDRRPISEVVIADDDDDETDRY
jgi:hypothetical protein